LWKWFWLTRKNRFWQETEFKMFLRVDLDQKRPSLRLEGVYFHSRSFENIDNVFFIKTCSRISICYSSIKYISPVTKKIALAWYFTLDKILPLTEQAKKHLMACSLELSAAYFQQVNSLLKRPQHMILMSQICIKF
jgi:hypothetical protein